MTISKDTTLAVVFIEDVIFDTFQFRFSPCLIEVFILQRDVAIGVFAIFICIVIIIMLVVITEEVGAFRQLDFLHFLVRDGDVLVFIVFIVFLAFLFALIVAHQDNGVAAEAYGGSVREAIKLIKMRLAIRKCLIHIIFLGVFQHGGVVGHHR